MALALRYPLVMDVTPDLDKPSQAQWDIDSGDVARFKAGDADAFESLVTRREREVFQVALRMLGDREAAQDAVQDTFLRAYRGLKSFRGDARFRTWLLGIAINVCRTRLSSAGERERHQTSSLTPQADGDGDPVELSISDASPGPDAAALGGELRVALARALLRLAPEFREVIILREIHQMDYEDMALAVSCPLGTVKSRLARARYALREALRGYWP